MQLSKNKPQSLSKQRFSKKCRECKQRPRGSERCISQRSPPNISL